MRDLWRFYFLYRKEGRVLHPTGLVGSVPHFEEPVSNDHALRGISNRGGLG